MRRRSTALCDHAAMPNLRFLPLALLASSAFALVWGGHVLLQLHGPPVAASSATLSEHEMEQINAMAPQDQVTRLLERTINHYKGAADEIAKRTDGWTGKIHSTADLQTMTNTAYFSDDLRVRAAALEIWLAEYNLRKNSATVDELIRDAAAGGDRKYFLLSNLGILGNRGVEPEKVFDALALYVHDPRCYQWTGFVGNRGHDCCSTRRVPQRHVSRLAGARRLQPGRFGDAFTRASAESRTGVDPVQPGSGA